ncbi:cytidine deaminase [Fodinibius salsisoli]|uniref:Cytidine deaminase n=1 Tax=Fodinibius salsisoli TaxID=2820877 RepID=A0ABT3PKY7_9BACT|nr:cytidine deaminase [Fodinibius salsisoli]MCW9706609.1 cytidine deaminase [Fodinibius salsisoli]
MLNLSEVLKSSYVPYSSQPEGALVHSAEGRFFPGIRVENISYPLSVSAAQNALFCCLSEGDTPQKLWITNNNDPLLPFWKQEYGLSIDSLDPDDLPADRCNSISIDNKVNPVDILPQLLPQARVRYSNFPVAALVKTNLGYFSGVNIECSAWNLGLCAERVAIFKALSYRASTLLDLHIHTRSGEFSSPCGACRQVIIEHLQGQKIHLHHADGSQSIHFDTDLMPFSFRASSLSNSH